MRRRTTPARTKRTYCARCAGKNVLSPMLVMPYLIARRLAASIARAISAGGSAASMLLVAFHAAASTGLLVDAAAWNATRSIEAALPPAEIARAIDAASRRAIRYGITSIGDNTFFPAHLAQYVRLVRAGVVRLRITARSYGPESSTRLAMNSQGASQFGGRS